MGLHPAIILLSLSIWGSLFGVVGMIIALPMTTLIISYYGRFIIDRGVIENLVSMPYDDMVRPTEESKGEENEDDHNL